MPNFVKIDQGNSSLSGKFLRKIRHFRDFEILKPTYYSLMLKFCLRGRLWESLNDTKFSIAQGILHMA